MINALLVEVNCHYDCQDLEEVGPRDKKCENLKISSTNYDNKFNIQKLSLVLVKAHRLLMRINFTYKSTP